MRSNTLILKFDSMLIPYFTVPVKRLAPSSYYKSPLMVSFDVRLPDHLLAPRGDWGRLFGTVTAAVCTIK